ncbi:MAG: sigma-70 family RNA polymerase sigma factor, partial [Lachnospiraceae bacterium]|nr:sigma-70 family RNA polymerase sigma factor [Lachnospiraceae bacterium]
PAQEGPHTIVEVIRAMPEQYRTILELKFVLEWKDKEIARHLGLPLSTVTSRIHRGRKLLQDALIKEGYAP